MQRLRGGSSEQLLVPCFVMLTEIYVKTAGLADHAVSNNLLAMRVCLQTICYYKRASHDKLMALIAVIVFS